jgi:hypothetical protein
MKKILVLAAVAAALVAVNCKSIDKAKVGGKEVVVASQMNLVIFTAMGAPVTACLDDLGKEGVSTVTNVGGQPTGGLFSTFRLSSVEGCQAAGTK